MTNRTTALDTARARRRIRTVVCGVIFAVTGSVALAGAVAQASTAFAAPPIVLDGHGYGHGIGLSQYGALGYAVDLGWSASQILDHYYGGTVSSTAPPVNVTVRLSGLDGQQTSVVHDKGALVIDGFAPAPGQSVTWRSLVAREVADGRYRVWGRTDAAACPNAAIDLDDPASGWVVVVADQPGSVTFRPQTDASASADISDLVGVCEPATGRVRYYRGSIRAINNSSGVNRTVSDVPLEQYLRSVVGGEVSWGWAAMGGGRGAQALQAQAVAARSYALAENRESVARTCDNVCQTYRGAAYRSGLAGAIVPQEFGPTDAAVQATAGIVRRYGTDTGAIAYTMYSSSSGGHTATNTLGFTPVPDEGDAVDGNAGHSWTVTLDASRVEAAYPAIGSFSAFAVTSRDGNGEWGGRVLTMTVTGSAGTVTTTGAAFRSQLGLKSNWFRIRGDTPAPPVAAPPESCAGREAAVIPGAVVSGVGSRFTPLPPRRLVDTRIGVGTDARALGAGCTLTVDAGVADDSTAVVVNVTSVDPAMNGFLTAYPCGTPRPWTSIVPAVARRIVPGTAIVPVDGDGRFCLFASQTTDIVIDLTGVYRAGAGDGFEPIEVQRRFDSRGGALVRGGQTVRVPIAGSLAIPQSATAVALTVHSTNATAPAFVTIWPCAGERPTTSILNTTPGASVTNHVQVGLDADGAVCLYVQSPMHLVVDVSGWFGATAASEFHALEPWRALDTREGTGLAGRFRAGQNREIAVTGLGGVPSTGVRAIAAEVTAVDAAVAGYITVHPCQVPTPDVSMVRNQPGTIAATTVTGLVDAHGRWCLQTSVAMDALIDISGFYG